jgi:hypothetical protein
MRLNKLFLVLGATVLAGLLVAFVGCGSDDKSTGDIGSNSDPEFQVVQNEINFFIDSTMESFANGLDNIYGLATDTIVDPIRYGPLPPDYDPNTDTATATYADGWHAVYIAIHRETYDAWLRDSIQFIKDGEPKQLSTELDVLVYKHYWKYDVTDTAVTHRSYTGNTDYTFTDLNTNTAVINGNNELQVHSKVVADESTVWRDITVEATLTEVQVKKTPEGWAQGCPSSGTITASIEMVYQKDDNDPVTTNWSVNVSFDNGNMTVVVVRGTTSWLYNTHLCTPPN